MNNKSYANALTQLMTSKYVDLPRNLVKADHPLEISIYAKDGTLLVCQGSSLSDQQALSLLQHEKLLTINEELIRALELLRKAKAARQQNNPSHVYKLPAAIDRLKKLEADLQEVYMDPAHDRSNLQLTQLTGRLQSLCKEAPDIALAKIILDDKTSYTIRHSLHTATVCELIASHQRWSKEDRRPLVSAALSMNISLGFLQDELAAQASPLTGDQRLIIENHPTKSASMLINMGIKDQSWLEYVEKHHEQTDGSGYPDGLTSIDLPFGAVILNIADIYCAKITGRQYRDPSTPDVAARDFFLIKDKHINGSLIEVFVKVLGIYPPG